MSQTDIAPDIRPPSQNGNSPIPAAPAAESGRPRRFSAEQRRVAVDLANQIGVAEASRRLGIHYNNLRRWRNGDVAGVAALPGSPGPGPRAPRAMTTARPVVELVKANPPEKRVPFAEQIGPLLQQILAAGATGDDDWFRIALFPTASHAERYLQRVRVHYPAPWEWRAARVPATEQSALYDPPPWAWGDAKVPAPQQSALYVHWLGGTAVLVGGTDTGGDLLPLQPVETTPRPASTSPSPANLPGRFRGRGRRPSRP